MKKLVQAFLLLTLMMPIWLFGQEPTKVLTLDECVQIALEKNSDYIMSKLNKDIARKEYLSSYSSILPELSVSYDQSKYERGPTSYIGNDYIGIDPNWPPSVETTVGRTYFFLLRVKQNIFDGGRWFLNIKKTKYDQEKSLYDYLAARQNVIVTVRQYYMDLLKQEKLLEVYEQAVKRSEEQLERSKSMYQVGSVAQIDVFRSEVNLGKDRINYLTQKNKVLEARRNLNLAMGLDPDTPIEIDRNVHFERIFNNLDELVEQALAQNPTVKSREYNLKSTKYNVKLAKSAFLPDISLYYNYQRRVPRFAAMYEERDREYTYTVGLSVSWNLFNGFSDYLAVQKAKLSERYAQEQFNYEILSLKSKISTLFNNLKAYDEIIKINQQNLAASKEDYRLAQERYQLGSGTILELREAQVNLAQAEQQLVTAEFDAYITYAELQQAIGQLVNAY